MDVQLPSNSRSPRMAGLIAENGGLSDSRHGVPDMRRIGREKFLDSNGLVT